MTTRIARRRAMTGAALLGFAAGARASAQAPKPEKPPSGTTLSESDMSAYISKVLQEASSHQSMEGLFK